MARWLKIYQRIIDIPIPKGRGFLVAAERHRMTEKNLLFV